MREKCWPSSSISARRVMNIWMSIDCECVCVCKCQGISMLYMGRCSSIRADPANIYVRRTSGGRYADSSHRAKPNPSLTLQSGFCLSPKHTFGYIHQYINIYENVFARIGEAYSSA